MPGKRARKDSERSIGSNGPPSSHSADVYGGSGAGSSSSGSVGDDAENMKACSYPSGCPNGEDSQTDVNSMVKVICSNDNCKMSQFMHTECFNHWEEMLLNFLRTHGRARSWSEKQRRQNLWSKRGYDLIFRACLCKCKRGHLKKDVDWTPPASPSAAHQDTTKKKNRKKQKDLPSLGGYNGVIVKSKSKPIPNSKDNRMRHSSASSSISVDQGYNSASPGTTEAGSSVFSPPSHHHRSIFSFHTANGHSNRIAASFHAPSTSPLPEVPDDNAPLSPQFTRSPNSGMSPILPLRDVFTPPLSPESEFNKLANPPRTRGPSPPGFNQYNPSHDDPQNDVQAMSAYIETLLQHRADKSATVPIPPSQNRAAFQSPNSHSLENEPRSFAQVEHALAQMRLENMNLSDPTSAGNAPNLPSVPYNSPALTTGSFLEECRRRSALSSSWSNGMVPRVNDLTSMEHRHPATNAQVLMALRQKEQKESESRDMNTFLMGMMTTEEPKPQVFTMSANRSRHNSHTEVRVVPMRSTNFTKRYDFTIFQEVLAHQLINPYHIKMEGEGYGSDDLRNFILANLSKERCSQMNCVVCGVDLPVYDHFPLVDGTMFLSPEKNERSTKNCFKIKIEGKFDFVHAACIRCMEGLHNIVCRFCNSRWEGAQHQLGSLYMFDIFAASPCCQKRLCCKHCGNIVVDIRQGLNFFSDYSSQKACPSCKAVDYHFVHPVTTYQLMGLVFS